MFVYKHTETIEYVYFFRKIQASGVNNWRSFRIKNERVSGYCFYIKPNIE